MDEHSLGCQVIIDNGSGTVRAGFSGDDHTRVELRSVISTCPTGPDKSRELFGEDALRIGDSKLLRYPIKRGVVNNWDDMTRCVVCIVEALVILCIFFNL